MGKVKKVAMAIAQSIDTEDWGDFTNAAKAAIAVIEEPDECDHEWGFEDRVDEDGEFCWKCYETKKEK